MKHRVFLIAALFACMPGGAVLVPFLAAAAFLLIRRAREKASA